MAATGVGGFLWGSGPGAVVGWVRVALPQCGRGIMSAGVAWEPRRAGQRGHLPVGQHDVRKRVEHRDGILRVNSMQVAVDEAGGSLVCSWAHEDAPLAEHCLAALEARFGGGLGSGGSGVAAMET